MNSEIKSCQNCKKDFIIESDDFAFYKKIGVPTPTWCPDCRFTRRLTFINHRSLYKRNCENCNASIISMYSTDVQIPVWCTKCHISDVWDARDYAKNYDFSKSFFEQFQDLKYNVPHRALDQNERNSTGCEYSNYCFTCKDAYLSFSLAGSENVKYSAHIFKGNKNVIDSLDVKESDRVYENVQSRLNYNSSFLVESDQCVDSHFLFDCSNCVNCCLSSNLRNKSNVFKNRQLSKDEYQKAIADLNLGTYLGQMEAKNFFSEIYKNAIHRHAHIKNSINTVGDFVENSKNVSHCSGLVEAENTKYVYYAMNTLEDCQDVMFSGMSEECYEFTYGGRGASRVIFSLSCGGGCRNLFYCDSCRGCSDCFGCVGLSKKQYCILNKQYTKEEYFIMIEKIKTHMNNMLFFDKKGKEYPFGEFFPSELSPFAYNESIAFEESPLSREEVLASGYKWKEPEIKNYVSTIKSEALPENIFDIEDSICEEVIECPNLGGTQTQCVSAYRILPDELSFYRQMNLPIPRYCPNCRYHQRLAWKNPFHFYKRECMCELSNHNHKARCSNKFETMYSPNRPEKIYCKECYQKEIY